MIHRSRGGGRDFSANFPILQHNACCSIVCVGLLRTNREYIDLYSSLNYTFSTFDSRHPSFATPITLREVWGSHLKNGWSIRPLDTVYAVVALGAVPVPRKLQRPCRLHVRLAYRDLRVRTPRGRNLSSYERNGRQSITAVSLPCLFQCRPTRCIYK